MAPSRSDGPSCVSWMVPGFRPNGHIEQTAVLCVALMRQTGSIVLALDLPDLDNRRRASLGETAFDELSAQPTAELGDTVRATRRQIHFICTQLEPSA